MILIEPIRNGKWIKDGAYLLAIQYWAVENLDPDEIIIFPYICDPHVQIGYFQNPEVEINFDLLTKRNFPVVRRDTGGGAIYIDDLSANFSFSIPYNKYPQMLGNYSQFYAPIITILKNLGAKDVVFSGKNDLTINNKKISGAAMSLVKNRIYAGFSLLYDIDFETIEALLVPNRKKIEAKGIKSIAQRVEPLKNHLESKYQNLDSFGFKDLILQQYLVTQQLSQFQKFVLSDQAWAEIDELVAKKYKNWDWTYGLSPGYSYNRDARLEIGTINFSLEIEGFKIKKAKVSGDFFAKTSLSVLEEALINCRLDYQDLYQALSKINFDEIFFKPIEISKIIETILS
ncbi:Lipoate-protein ligase A [Mesomycoplasma conjunctivae]|uniref:lipoate--protein ligase n=1 Tax=Mesomycoplasma conjunctivae (strain ATCC 25834 / NCTC 10147 / HRC/581) TaxID=572263 RepID=C5J6L5_MESCH|nr:lipoate--protein ligase [Mesomycoplasma conjunctivae]CAT05111.1 Lipoate-protein ligase [Mesomycoplasma conjunctivae]VEU66372.1 Lipoate-protein ligase A [Mesomycoplasma conjunctivae]